MNEILIILGLILLNGILSMTEMAMVSARKSSLSTEARNGNERARRALSIAENPNRMLSTIQIGITLIGILTGIYSGSKLAGSLATLLDAMGMAHNYSMTLAQGVIVIIVTFLTLLFGELLPKRIGMATAESIAKTMAAPMNYLSTMAAPFVWLLSKSTAVIFSLIGLHDEGSKVTEEEIKSIIQEGKDSGEVQPMEEDLVNRIFMMGDLTVGSIMTSKHDLVCLDLGQSAEEIKTVIRENLYEVYPVSEGSMDNIRGLALLKDLFVALDDKDFALEKLIRPATYFHENTSIYKMLEQMKSENISRGLVCDEYGSCLGIVTLKDMMEGIVGNIEDGNAEDPQIVKCHDREAWLVDGQCSMYDFLTFFDSEDLMESDADYTTVAGLCLTEMERVPSTGEHFTWKGFKFQIVDKDNARIDKLMVSRE
ncbi:MAG: HlyC/CorC family transporter [Bacteroidaceae bacterium]|nr:HlyC/CorC family transporter [Bacteroidaceae bacterium]